MMHSAAEVRIEHHSPEGKDLGTYSECSLDREASVATCRVCQIAESDRRGDAALEFLRIVPPLQESCRTNMAEKPGCQGVVTDIETGEFHTKTAVRGSGLVEFTGPGGEVFICNTDMEMGPFHQQDSLIELGCSCKNDLALVHYACALKWFVNHGSTICEICGHPAENIDTEDIKRVMVSLKEYETLKERTASGDPNPSHVNVGSGIDPDAVAAIRRQRLSEISLWFGPLNNSNRNNSAAASQVVSEQLPNTITENANPTDNPATKWAVEGMGILLATCLLTVTLAWLIAPHVGKKTARSGLHILLGGVCALAVVIFFRFFVLTRINCYWAILFVFWFLVFAIWASRAHGVHTT